MPPPVSSPPTSSTRRGLLSHAAFLFVLIGWFLVPTPEPDNVDRQPHRFGQFKLPKNVRVKGWGIRVDDGAGDVPDRRFDGWWCDEISDEADAGAE
jgi:hypothetical protein